MPQSKRHVLLINLILLPADTMAERRFDGATDFSARRLRIERTISWINPKSVNIDSSLSSDSRGSGQRATISASGQSDARSAMDESRIAFRRYPHNSSVTNGVNGWSKRNDISNMRVSIMTVCSFILSFFICSFAISTYQSAKSDQKNS